MDKKKQLRSRKDKINISFLLEALYPYLCYCHNIKEMPQSLKPEVLEEKNEPRLKTPLNDFDTIFKSGL